MYVYIYIHVYVYVYIHIYVYVYIHICESSLKPMYEETLILLPVNNDSVHRAPRKSTPKGRCRFGFCSSGEGR